MTVLLKVVLKKSPSPTALISHLRLNQDPGFILMTLVFLLAYGIVIL